MWVYCSYKGGIQSILNTGVYSVGQIGVRNKYNQHAKSKENRVQYI